jgi:hypothetical protein
VVRVLVVRSADRNHRNYFVKQTKGQMKLPNTVNHEGETYVSLEYMRRKLRDLQNGKDDEQLVLLSQLGTAGIQQGDPVLGIISIIGQFILTCAGTSVEKELRDHIAAGGGFTDREGNIDNARLEQVKTILNIT